MNAYEGRGRSLYRGGRGATVPRREDASPEEGPYLLEYDEVREVELDALAEALAELPDGPSLARQLA